MVARRGHGANHAIKGSCKIWVEIVVVLLPGVTVEVEIPKDEPQVRDGEKEGSHLGNEVVGEAVV